MGRKTTKTAEAPRTPSTRLAAFPDRLYVTRSDEEDSHYFLAHEDIGGITGDEANGDVVVYERRTLGRLVVNTELILEGQN
jgi:hypothetical protein